MGLFNGGLAFGSWPEIRKWSKTLSGHTHGVLVPLRTNSLT